MAERGGEPGLVAAWIGALAILADAEAGKSAIKAAADQLIAAAENEDKTEAAARMFTLWTAAGTAPPSEARTFLSVESPTDQSSSAPGDAIAVWAAARSGTAAEVVLRTVSLTLTMNSPWNLCRRLRPKRSYSACVMS